MSKTLISQFINVASKPNGLVPERQREVTGITRGREEMENFRGRRGKNSGYVSLNRNHFDQRVSKLEDSY